MGRKKHDPAKAKLLDSIYQEVPGIECKGLCHQACGPIVQVEALTGQELLRMQDEAGLRRGRMKRRPFTCPYLNASQACDVYELRPMICRLWGVAEGMPCPFGCVPDRVLSRDEGSLLLQTTEEVGGRMHLGDLAGLIKAAREPEQSLGAKIRMQPADDQV